MDPGPHMRVEVFRIAELISGEIVKVELAIVRDKELHTSGWTEFQRIGTVIVDVVRSQETGRDLEPAIGGVCQTGPLYSKGLLAQVRVVEVFEMGGAGQVGQDVVMHRNVETKLIGKVVVLRAQMHCDGEAQQEQ